MHAVLWYLDSSSHSSSSHSPQFIGAFRSLPALRTILDSLALTDGERTSRLLSRRRAPGDQAGGGGRTRLPRWCRFCAKRCSCTCRPSRAASRRRPFITIEARIGKKTSEGGTCIYAELNQNMIELLAAIGWIQFSDFSFCRSGKSRPDVNE